MFDAVTARIEELARGWARRRQGQDPAAGVRLHRYRIYILPTRYGAMFALVVFAMLLGSINYSSSMGFALTFLLAGLILVVMHHCHNNLLGLRIRFAGAQPVFAGETARFRISISNDASMPRIEVEVSRSKEAADPVDIEPGQTATAHVPMPAPRRGWVALERFALSTRYPAGFFVAWAWLHMSARCLVYPEPAPPGRPWPLVDSGSGGGSSSRRGDSDFYGLRNAVASDSPRQIAWKAYARNDELLAKEFAGSDAEPQTLDWESLADLDTEARLSQLTRWCLDAHARAETFGLRIPGTTITPGRGEHHLDECLGALALFEMPGGR